MMSRCTVLRLPLRFALLAAVVTAASRCDDKKPLSSPVAIAGLEHKVLLNDLSRPRGAVTDSAGNLLVVEQGGKGRSALQHVHCVKQRLIFIKLNHGIALSADGTVLFASSSTDVYAYPYDAITGEVGSGSKVVTGMDQGGHATRTLLIPRHNPDLLLVSRGSDGNIDVETTDIGSARSQIRTFRISELLEGYGPIPYSNGAVLGWGLRNSVGVADDPSTGNIWSVENSIDNMKRGGKDIHNTNPGEELNFHGRPDDADSDVYGKNYGYPACVAIFDSSNVENYPGGAAIGKQMVGDQMPSNYTDTYCQEETVSPYITFESHLAPLDVEFQEDGSAAYVSMHGSWNRQPPKGYRLSRVTFADGFPVKAKDSQDAEEKIMWNADETQCPRMCFRPVGLALEPDGKRLFMTSDSTGELFVMTGFQASGYSRVNNKIQTSG
ncbi:hypothetical protein RJ55_08194 [Drechmeria coniospora]|nr:hypothetical protein RJ55_08194 [Drechmeria coniospora]